MYGNSHSFIIIRFTYFLFSFFLGRPGILDLVAKDYLLTSLVLEREREEGGREREATGWLETSHAKDVMLRKTG